MGYVIAIVVVTADRRRLRDLHGAQRDAQERAGRPGGPGRRGHPCRDHGDRRRPARRHRRSTPATSTRARPCAGRAVGGTASDERASGGGETPAGGGATAAPQARRPSPSASPTARASRRPPERRPTRAPTAHARPDSVCAAGRAGTRPVSRRRMPSTPLTGASENPPPHRPRRLRAPRLRSGAWRVATSRDRPPQPRSEIPSPGPPGPPGPDPRPPGPTPDPSPLPPDPQPRPI